MAKSGFQIFLVIAFAGLAACGGGGGGGGSPTEDPDPLPNPDPATEPVEMRAASEDLLDIYADPINYTALSGVPTTGSASYRGYLSGELSNVSDDLPDNLIGNLTIDIQFGTALSVTGTATNFFDEDNNAVSGSLSLSGGQLDRTGNPNQDATFVLLADGLLTDDDGDQMDLASQLEGDFLGAQHNALGGAVFGRVTSGSSVQDFDGNFITAR